MTQMALLLQPPRLDRDAALRASKRQGDEAIAAGAAKASVIDPAFIANARAHIVGYLRQHGQSTGEILSDSCKLAKIETGQDRHFGAVFQGLLRDGVVRIVGTAARVKGHGSAGGKVYELVEDAP